MNQLLSFIDAIIRLLPNVLGNPSSLLEESFNNDLIEYLQYTNQGYGKY